MRRKPPEATLRVLDVRGLQLLEVQLFQLVELLPDLVRLSVLR